MTTPRIKNEPCEMVSLRTVRIANTSGHCIILEANKPALVPAPLVSTALELGCVPANAQVYEDHKNQLAAKVRAEEQLLEDMISGITALVKRNNFEDFTPTGHPKIDVLAEIIDVDPNRITQELRDHAFAEWNTRNRGVDRAGKKESRAAQAKPAAPAVESKPAT